MLRSEESIRHDTISATAENREALHQCIYIIKQYSEDQILELILKEETIVRTIKDLRLEYGRPKMMRLQYKQAKTHLRWLKYLIIKPKRPYSRSNRQRRKNRLLQKERKA